MMEIDQHKRRSPRSQHWDDHEEAGNRYVPTVILTSTYTDTRSQLGRAYLSSAGEQNEGVE